MVLFIYLFVLWKRTHAQLSDLGMFTFVSIFSYYSYSYSYSYSNSYYYFKFILHPHMSAA